MTNGVGSWEKISHGEYKYTWVAYGFADALPIYTARVSGFGVQSDCDHTGISYTVEFFVGALPPQDLSNADPVAVFRGTSTETRMPLVVTP